MSENDEIGHINFGHGDEHVNPYEPPYARELDEWVLKVEPNSPQHIALTHRAMRENLLGTIRDPDAQPPAHNLAHVTNDSLKILIKAAQTDTQTGHAYLKASELLDSILEQAALDRAEELPSGEKLTEHEQKRAEAQRHRALGLILKNRAERIADRQPPTAHGRMQQPGR